MRLDTEVNLGAGDAVLDGVAAPPKRGTVQRGTKRGGAVPLPWSAGNPFNTMWPEPRSTFVPSGVTLTHQNVIGYYLRYF